MPLTDVTRIIDFEEIQATATSINVRPDLWVFPFLNVYGIFWKAYATIEVKISYPFELKALAELEGASYGVGTTGAFGVGKYFVVLDGNWVWSNMSNFEEPVKSSVFSFRFGRAFQVGKNPERNIAFWVGGMRVRMGGITDGKITLYEVLPDETWNKRDEIVDNYYDWYDGLNALDPKKSVADKLFTPIIENISTADGDGTIHYRLEKKPVREWNMIVGGQFQINKRWQIRSEGGIVGDRKSFLASVNYRFGF